MPPPPGLSGSTLRQVVYVSIGGEHLRVHFSNAYGTAPLTIRGARVARSAGRARVVAQTVVGLQFEGKTSVTIPAGESITSDPFEFLLEPLSELAVSIYFGDVPLDVTGHPGSRTTSYVQQGDAIADLVLTHASAADHWYVLSGIDVVSSTASRAVVTFGDSLTDGRGSTTNGNDRWPDVLSRRLRANGPTRDVAVLNAGMGGNAVVSGGLGPTASARFERDVLRQAGVRWLIVLAGVNDVGNAGLGSVRPLTDAYANFVRAARAYGILAYGVPLLPFGGSQYCNPSNEAARQKVNSWIRAPGHFDRVLDLELAVRDPREETRIRGEYDSGDHLHLNPAGYRQMADSVDLELFRSVP